MSRYSRKISFPASASLLSNLILPMNDQFNVHENLQINRFPLGAWMSPSEFGGRFADGWKVHLTVELLTHILQSGGRRLYRYI